MPIRIRDRSTSDAITRARPGSQPAPNRVAAPATSFGEALVTARQSQIRRDLDRLYLDIEEQGRRFLEQPTPEELERYKQHIREFIAYVVKNGLKLRSSLTARELHQIIDRVDEDLLGLADALLAQERPLFDMAAKVTSINGMLLDLKA